MRDEYMQFPSIYLQNYVKGWSELDIISRVDDELDDLKEPERSNLHSFLVNLFAYSIEVQREYRPMELSVIFHRSINEGPSFAKWLDGFRSYVLGRYAKRKYFSQEIYEGYKGIDFNTKDGYIDVSGLYRPNSLFKWIPEVPDIRDISFQPVEQKESTLLEFREALKKVLRSAYPEPSRYRCPTWTTLTSPSDKGTFEGKNYREPQAYPAEVRGISRLAPVNRELKGARLACVEEYSSSLRIRWIEKCMQILLGLDSRNVMKLSPGVLKARMRKEIKHGRHVYTSYQRDFNKEGLTKPRNIIRIMMEELYEWTKWESFECVGFFDDWKILDVEGNDIVIPPRGHGLGMCNSLTTLMSLTIEEMVLCRLGCGPHWSGYNNDDACMIFSSEVDARNYARIDRDVCEELGLDFKPKATYICFGEAMLCEQYVKHDNFTYGWKGTYYSNSFLNILKAENSAHAKFLASSEDTRYVRPELLKLAVRYWKWTLYRNEHQRPSLFGGWFNRKTGLTDSTFIDVESEDKVPREELAAFMAYRSVERKQYPWLNVKVKNRLFDFYDEELLLKMQHEKNVYVKDIKRISFDKYESRRSWKMYQDILVKNFNRYTKLYDIGELSHNYGDLYRMIVKENPNIDVIPPKGLRHERSSVETSLTDLELFNPYGTFGFEIDMNCLSIHGSEYPFIRNERDFNLSLNKGRDRYNYRGARARAKELGLPENWETYVMPPEQALEHYCNPFNVTRVCDEFGSNYACYIPDETFEEKVMFLKSRDHIYNCKLQVKDWIEIGKLRPTEIAVIQFLYWKSKRKEVSETLLKFLKEYPGCGHFLNFLKYPDIKSIIEELITFKLWKDQYETPSETEIPKYDRRKVEGVVPLTYEACLEMLDSNQENLNLILNEDERNANIRDNVILESDEESETDSYLHNEFPDYEDDDSINFEEDDGDPAVVTETYGWSSKESRIIATPDDCDFKDDIELEQGFDLELDEAPEEIYEEIEDDFEPLDEQNFNDDFEACDEDELASTANEFDDANFDY